MKPLKTPKNPRKVHARLERGPLSIVQRGGFLVLVADVARREERRAIRERKVQQRDLCHARLLLRRGDGCERGLRSMHSMRNP